jgi:hypothetical protein
MEFVIRDGCCYKVVNCSKMAFTLSVDGMLIILCFEAKTLG